MYSQGLAAIVFCEAYRLSKNAEYRNAAQRAINYIVKAQNQQTGGWQYNPGDPGDTCVVGWQVAALESARHAKLLVPRAALDGARHWLDSCAKGSDHSLYSYVPANLPTGNMTAIGLRCRQYLGALPNDPMFVAGVPYLRSRTLVHDPATAMDLYGCYFAIQVVHRMGPDVWNAWNSMLQGGLRASQNAQDASNGARIKIGGRLLMTAVATLILEMPYSQLSIHQ
jgi:hypothetical protein